MNVYENLNTNLKSKTQKAESFNMTFFLYIILTFCVYTLPALKLTIPYVIAGSLMLLLLPIVCLKDKEMRDFSILLIFWTMITLFLNLVLGQITLVDSINEAIRAIRFFMPALWTVFALKYCNIKQNKSSLIIILIILAIVLLKTLQALESDPWISRILAQDKATDDAEIRAYRLQNIGGFEFSYAVGIIALCFVWTALASTKKTIKICSIILAIICFYYIIQTMYTTLLLITFLGALLLVLFGIKNKEIKVIIGIISIIAVFALPSLLKYLSGVFNEDSLLSTKFMHMYEALTGGGTDSLGSRPKYISMAIQNWLKSPIWGGYALTPAVHSFVFGLLESNGIIGITLFGLCFKLSYNITAKQLKSRNINLLLFNIVMGYVLVLAILNPIGYVFEVMIAAFYIAPIWQVVFHA